jgi:drug/metabolite transporter (DMT)-like permease
LGALALALAVGSSIVWGAADFAGGSLTKRLPTLAVTVLSQTAGFVALLAIVAVRGEVGGRPFVLGLLGGIGGGVGLAAFYRALSLGTMSVVSPVVACGAVLPFAISIATGERPSGLALAGAGAALGGAVLASVEERRSRSSLPARSASSSTFSGSAAVMVTRCRRCSALVSAR